MQCYVAKEKYKKGGYFINESQSWLPQARGQPQDALPPFNRMLPRTSGVEPGADKLSSAK
jgi:hypothetical protein